MRPRLSLIAAGALFLIVACQKQEKDDVTLHEIMTGTVDPVADVVWNLSSKLYGDNNEVLTEAISDAEWKQIQLAGRDMRAGATMIINNPDLQVVRPGGTILDENKVTEAVTAAQVEIYLDRDRAGLGFKAQELAVIASQIENAARTRDAVKTLQLSEDLDNVCESCHQKYWYPDNAALTGKLSSL